jgi:hypothetical protein
VEVSDVVLEDMVVLEAEDVVLAVVVDVPVVVDTVELEVLVVEDRVALVPVLDSVVLELKVKLVVDDSVDVVRPSHLSSQSS